MKNVFFTSVESAIKDIELGKMIIIANNSDIKNEGNLVCAAERISHRIINFMVKHARGLICVPMKHERLKELKIDNMVESSIEKEKCSFTISVDYKLETTTGISAYDKVVTTIKKLIDKTTKSEDFIKPGYVFPLKYNEGGVLVKSGYAEAIIDLVNLAGLYPAGVVCKIMNDCGTVTRMINLIKFAEKYKLKIITIDEIIKYRRTTEKLVIEVVNVDLPTKYGDFRLICFENVITKDFHLAVVKGNVKNKQNVLVRVHSSCETGDIFHSLRCDCGEQLKIALTIIGQIKQGVILYMHQEGRGIGLINKLKAYSLQEKGMDTVEANIALGFAPDLRDYWIASQILHELGVKSVNVMTNNPQKIMSLKEYGLKITKRIPLEITPTSANIKYLKTKMIKMGHILEIV
ncbi:MAG: GTP cyclohydrolase II [Endomicrobium sp.]|jgi:3,4-dihydroxy 2-butanone 4-phosphate synthase/GTP cyclohydrolase II|nr:GTP cyclohydrolase II [Endomicrobium sp.]